LRHGSFARLIILNDLLRRLIVPNAPARTGAPGTDSYAIAGNDLGIYCVPLKAAHRPACQAILHGQIWEERTIDFIREHANGDIVHGGAFFGDMLPAFSRAFDQVWAFEPNPDSFKCARVTLRLNDISNVTLVDAAMGARPGSASLTTEWDGIYLGGGSFIREGAGDIAIVPIDDAVPADRRVGVIHLDVEGYEGKALAGALKTIERWRPLLILETVPHDSSAMQSIVALGYEPGPKVDENFVYGPKARNARGPAARRSSRNPKSLASA
jgi:FkbM family methyltransferase